MSAISAPQLSPRDASALSNLKRHQLSLIEIKVTEFSPCVGNRLASLPLPDTTKSLCVIRNNRPIMETEALFLEEGDMVYLITDNTSIIREVFTLL